MYKYSVNVKNVDKEYHKSVFCAFDILLTKATTLKEKYILFQVK